jgi:DNA-binding transcriptional LysR family regulator
MDTLLSMTVFRTVVELKSFAAAARRMGMSPAMVTKHVMHLEKRLKTRLLNRTSRHLSLTETGALYFEQTKNTLDELHAVETAVTGSTTMASGLLKITVPAWMACQHFLRLLALYQRQYPQVRLDIDLSGRQVNLVDEGFDLALRVAPKMAETLIARPLGKVPFKWVAAPSYIRDRGAPKTKGQLASHSLLAYSLIPLNESLPEASAPTLLCNNETVLLGAALEGMGIASLPIWLVETELAQGQLVELLVDENKFEVEVFGVYASRKYLSSKVRTFLDFMDQHLI